MSKIKTRAVSLLAIFTLLFTGAAGITATPAAADPPSDIDCGGPAAFCLWRSWNPGGGGLVGFSESYFATNPRNTCIPLATFDDNAYENETSVHWWLFHTTTCNGSHIDRTGNGAAGPLPAGWNNGSVHAVMRTSTLA